MEEEKVADTSPEEINNPIEESERESNKDIENESAEDTKKMEDETTNETIEINQNIVKEEKENNSTEEVSKVVEKSESQAVEEPIAKAESSRKTTRQKSNVVRKDTAKSSIHRETSVKKKEIKIKEPKMQASTNIEDPLTKVRAPTPEPIKKAGSNSKLVDIYPHRHYPAIHPCCNRLLEMRWDIASRQKHLKKLAAVKPTVDFTAPKPYKHLQLKSKKLQMQQGRIYSN